jgi:hypothetical protein
LEDLGGRVEERRAFTMLPAWSLKVMPLVFIILIYGLLKLLTEKPWVWGQGADMSLRTTWWVVNESVVLVTLACAVSVGWNGMVLFKERGGVKKGG